MLARRKRKQHNKDKSKPKPKPSSKAAKRSEMQEPVQRRLGEAHMKGPSQSIQKPLLERSRIPEFLFMALLQGIETGIFPPHLSLFFTDRCPGVPL